MPPLMNNHGNYIVSLGNVCRWLAGQAEALGVEIYPGFAAAGVLYNENGAVPASTGDMGVERNGDAWPELHPAWNCMGKYVLIGEGARGSLAKQLIAKFDLDEGREPQKYGIGLKELWQVKPENHKPGLVQHSFGWPLDMKTGGGSFLYHLDHNLVAVGFVVHLNYKNPYLYAIRGVPALQDAPRRSAAPSKAPSASPTARAPSPRVAGSRCRSCPSPAAR
jgi:electron-transferring-flavoprotein dehydrogenase